MIKPNELRIGNWLQWKDNKQAFEITIGLFTDYYFWNHIKHGDIEPILLTPEILEKCGCTQGEDKEMWRNSQGVWLTQRHNTDMFFINGFRSGHYIKYLHEYQNAVFALTGEEFQINLNVAATV